MMTEQPNYYAILGVDKHASLEEIHEAFATWRIKLKEAEQLESTQYQQIAYAYEVLSDSDRRTLYDSLLQETSAESVLEVHALLSRSKIGVLDTPQVVYLLVNVHPPQQAEDARLPLNLCLVLDRSTSMNGERLERVKTAVEMVLDKLGPEDVISVVSFSDRAEVLLPAGRVHNKVRLLSRVKSMLASGGTEIYQGLKTGVEEMRQVSLSQHINHLILLTDGHTYGDEALCVQLAKETAVQGIGITAFGIGLEWNDKFLDRLVAPSSGQSGYIDDPMQIIEYLEKRIKGLGAVYAQNVQFHLNFPNAVYMRYGFKMTPYAQPIDKEKEYVKLGDIEGRRPLSFLLELSIDPQPIQTRIKLPVHLTAVIPGKKLQKYTFKQDLQLMVLKTPLQEEPPEAVLRAVRMLNMYRMNEKVWEDVEAGNVEMATTRMRHLTTRFLEAGQTQLARQAQMEVDRLANVGDLSLEGRKTLKFGTRALLNQTMSLLLNGDEAGEHD
ncbi:MAG: VWA domain-containing protein [Ardenticatenaceae bacterium]|nr:VWA domain-containing protein [Anaerolineales bacterium]MCB8921285.1 VWA domain-containing protein [Ardenticatenaceae bacterium]MCB8990651.1 VWA domain-containing protein [Ardenticatenaceae bacterium]